MGRMLQMKNRKSGRLRLARAVCLVFSEEPGANEPALTVLSLVTRINKEKQRVDSQGFNICPWVETQSCSALRLRLRLIAWNCGEFDCRTRVADQIRRRQRGAVFQSAQQRTFRHAKSRGGLTFWQLLIFQYAVPVRPAMPSLTD